MDCISSSWSVALHLLSPATRMQMLEPLMRLMGKQVHTMPSSHYGNSYAWLLLCLTVAAHAGIAHLLEHMAFKGEQSQ